MRFKKERAIDLGDEEVSDIHKMDVLIAMLAFEMIWEELPFSVIKKCWEHTDICGSTLIDTVPLCRFDEEHHTAVHSCINRVVRIYARIEVSQRLNAEELN